MTQKESMQTILYGFPYTNLVRCTDRRASDGALTKLCEAFTVNSIGLLSTPDHRLKSPLVRSWMQAP
jgi:hypothetical protein